MDTEIEVKFVDIDLEAMRRKLKKSNAKLLQPMRLMKRVVIETEHLISNNAFVRIRDQGDKTTITYKQFDELSLTGAKEIEIEIDDFDKAVALFTASGLAHSSFQESKRETWRLDDVTIELDIWPWLNPYLEIEGPSETEVKSTAATLGFNWKDAAFGGVMAAYRVQYPHLDTKDSVVSLAEVKFNMPLPGLLKS